jgi:hypothetical protein
VGPVQAFEMVTGIQAADGIPVGDRYHVDRWLQMGGGVAEYNNYRGAYFNYYMTGAWLDQSLWTLALALSVYGPLLAVPVVNVLAQTQITNAQIQVLFATIATWWTATAALESAHYTTVNQIQAKEQDYITKKDAYDELAIVPDVQALKARLIDYGQRQRDPDDAAYDYYTLTEEDLDYLFETTGAGAQWKKSTGATYAPTAEQSFNGLDAAATRNPDGTYDLASVTRALQDHAANLRNQKLADYINAGNAADGGVFTLKERERTFRELYQESQNRTHGGQEYAGYLTTFDDYIANQQALYDIELNQKVAQQQKEWQLREQELNDAYNSWEARMAKVVERGQKSWSNAENKFLQSWRNWERDYDRAISDGNTAFEVKKQEHFAARQTWEAEVRNAATEANITATLSTAVDRMNQMIAGLNTGSDSDLQLIDKQNAINTAIAQLQLDEPGEAEKLANINKSIANFNTNLGISEIRSLSMGDKLATLRAEFYETSQEHQKSMQVFSNTKMFEQYRMMQKDIIAEIEEMNRQKREETHAAATGAGYQLEGGVYVKKGGIPAGLEDILAAYERFSALTEIGAGNTVNPYTNYDAEAGVDRVFGAIGAVSLSNVDEMIQNLETMDGVEMQAFMDYQMLLFDRGYKKIFGEGTGEERKTAAPDERIFGDLGLWIGRAPDGDSQWNANVLMRGLFTGYEIAKTAAIQTTTGGFGELGAATTRPSGPMPGFYVQLALTEALIESARAEESAMVAKREGAGALFTSPMRLALEAQRFGGHGADAMGAGKIEERLFGMAVREKLYEKANEFLDDPGGALRSRLSDSQERKADQAFRKLGFDGIDGGMQGLMAGGSAGGMGMSYSLLSQNSDDFVEAVHVGATIVTSLNFGLNAAWTYANGQYNVEMAHRTQLGKSKGYMWEAQYIAFAKPIANAVGALLIAGGGPPGIAAGSALIIAANSTQVNTQTGERGMQLTQQAAINSGISIAAAYLGGQSGGPPPAEMQMLQIAAGGIKYNERGRVSGYDFGQMGIQAGLTAFGAGVAGGVGAEGYAASAVASGSQQALTALIEYGKYRRGEQNNWAAYERGDPSLLGGQVAGALPGLWDLVKQKNAQDALLGAAYGITRRREEGGLWDGFIGGAGGALGFGEGGFWEKAGNWFKWGLYMSDRQLENDYVFLPEEEKSPITGASFHIGAYLYRKLFGNPTPPANSASSQQTGAATNPSGDQIPVVAPYKRLMEPIPVVPAAGVAETLSLSNLNVPAIEQVVKTHVESIGGNPEGTMVVVIRNPSSQQQVVNNQVPNNDIIITLVDGRVRSIAIGSSEPGVLTYEGSDVGRSTEGYQERAYVPVAPYKQRPGGILRVLNSVPTEMDNNNDGNYLNDGQILLQAGVHVHESGNGPFVGKWSAGCTAISLDRIITISDGGAQLIRYRQQYSDASAAKLAPQPNSGRMGAMPIIMNNFAGREAVGRATLNVNASPMLRTVYEQLYGILRHPSAPQ